MESTLKISIETHIKNKNGSYFETFVKPLHLEQHRVDEFIPTHEVSGKGSVKRFWNRYTIAVFFE